MYTTGQEIEPYWTIITQDSLLKDFGNGLVHLDDLQIENTKKKIRKYPTLFCWNVFNHHFKLMIPKDYTEEQIPKNYSLLKEYHKLKKSVIQNWKTNINSEEIMQFYSEFILRDNAENNQPSMNPSLASASADTEASNPKSKPNKSKPNKSKPNKSKKKKK